MHKYHIKQKAPKSGACNFLDWSRWADSNRRPADYESEFVCCSLNGRLWLYKTTDSAGIEKLVFFTLRWNETTGRMEFVDDGSGIFAIPANRPGEFPEAVVARGIDWILTSFFIVQVNKTAPYIQSKSVILRRQRDRKSVV